MGFLLYIQMGNLNAKELLNFSNCKKLSTSYAIDTIKEIQLPTF